jgi:integrin beta 3
VGAASVGAVSVKAGTAVVSGKVAGGAVVPVKPERAGTSVPAEGAAPVVGALAGAAKAAAEPDAAGNQPGGLRGAGAELRNKLRARRRLRVATLVSLAVVVLVVLPAIFGIVSANRDPVFASLDSLGVPSWAVESVDDQGSGSRWCYLDCRFRERTAQSDKSFEETTGVYTTALKKAGWTVWKVSDCPETRVDGTYSCWKRDEFTLDLWVRQPECAVDQVAAAQDPGALPPAAEPKVAPGKCVGSTVTIKVKSAIADTRGAPKQEEKPRLGETPDPVLSNDPLLQPTPKAS